MFYLLTVISVVSGGAIACAGHWYPRRAAQFETCGGVLLVGGLVMLGVSLPAVH